MSTPIEISQESRLLRAFIDRVSREGREAFSYEEAAKAISAHPVDPEFRGRLRRCVKSAERERSEVWVCDWGVGYRRAKPGEAADLLQHTRQRVVRKAKRTIATVTRLTKGHDLDEDAQRRLLVELTAINAGMSAMGRDSMREIESRVKQSELPSRDVFLILGNREEQS